jgi:hypothetical protein
MYRDVNNLFGDVVKVTPSSKCVGDLALYLINRKMKASEVLTRGDEIEFPQSTLDLCAGRLGFPHLGLPTELQRIVLKGETPMTKRPGELMPPADFAQKATELTSTLGRTPTQDEIMSSFLYPKVFNDCKSKGAWSVWPVCFCCLWLPGVFVLCLVFFYKNDANDVNDCCCSFFFFLCLLFFVKTTTLSMKMDR